MSSKAPGIRISYENLITATYPDPAPLSSLTLDEHIHGGLRLEIGGQFVPHLGFFGPDDVCFGNWLREFKKVSEIFQSGSACHHLFDEGEQGQPAFLFERQGDKAFFSITDSTLSSGTADPAWQRVEFSPHEFLREHERFRESFCNMLRSELPHVAESWIQEHA